MVKIVFTAFGKFQGVENNPTKDILKYIQSIKNFKQSMYKNICYTALIEVSAKGVSEHLLRIRDSIRNKYPTEKIIFIHMGVNGKAEKIHLENTGWNLMDFRVPDERKEQPRNTLIVNNDKLKSLNTKVNIDKLLSINGIKEYAKFSTDPGRFVCNYILFKSLYYNHTKINETSLFVHVPTFKVMNFEIQLECVNKIIDNVGKCFSLVIPKRVG